MAVRMPHSNKSGFFKWWIHCSTNYIFGCLYVELAMDSMKHRINWWWLGISRILCDLFRYFLSRTIWWRLFIRCYFAHTYTWPWLYSGILIMDVLSHSAVLIASYHMMMLWSKGCLHFPIEVSFTNTISGVLCISDTLLWCLAVNSSGETVPTRPYPRCWDFFN